MNPTRSQTRSLDDIAAEGGTFAIVAMDQRNTLRRMFTAVGRDGTDQELRDAKADVARALTPMASGLLSDPTNPRSAARTRVSRARIATRRSMPGGCSTRAATR
jgi:tagatose-1,6-bisphosphate aldolase